MNTALLVVIAVALGLAGMAEAQTYPSRPIRYVVPVPPGAGPDLVARLTAPHLSKALGQPVIVDNKPGAEGVIAATEVAKAAPDGYTLLGTNSTIVAANSVMRKQLPYDPIKSFVPISRLVTAALVLVVKPDHPAKSLREFIAQLKASPDSANSAYGSGGAQVASAMLRALTGVKFVEVAYKGNPQAINDVLSGNVSFSFSDYPGGFTLIRSGKLRGLAVTSRERTQLSPDLPAMAEEFPEFDVSVWSGLAAPAGTPREIVVRLAELSREAILQPEARARLLALSVEPAPLGPDETLELSRSEIAKWTRMAKLAGLRPE